MAHIESLAQVCYEDPKRLQHKVMLLGQTLNAALLNPLFLDQGIFDIGTISSFSIELWCSRLTLYAGHVE